MSKSEKVEAVRSALKSMEALVGADQELMTKDQWERFSNEKLMETYTTLAGAGELYNFVMFAKQDDIKMGFKRGFLVSIVLGFALGLIATLIV